MDTIKVKLKNGAYGYVGFERGFISIEGPTFWVRHKIASIVKSYINDNVPIPVWNIIRTSGGLKYDPNYSFIMKEMVSAYLLMRNE